MGVSFAVQYRSSSPVAIEDVEKIRQAAYFASQDWTWDVCDSVFVSQESNGCLLGISQLNALPFRPPVSTENGPQTHGAGADGLLNVLSELSRRFDIDWELSHNVELLPVQRGWIRKGIADGAAQEMMRSLVEVVGGLQDVNFDELVDEMGKEFGIRDS